MKKRDRKRFKRKDISISNVDIKNIDDFIDDEIAPDRRAEKKPASKSKISGKSNLKLIRGRIVELYSNYRCLVDIGDSRIKCHVSGRLKQFNLDTRNILAAGDWVKVDVLSKNRIEEIEERKNILVRYTEDSFQKKIIVASNLDHVVILTSCREPKINFGLVDRVLCSAVLNNIKPIICINKIDLEDDLKLLYSKAEFYRENGFDVVFSSAYQNKGITELQKILKNKDSVFVGHSGVGKSSLINVLQPGLDLKEGDVSEYTGKGLHTTTRSKIINWDFGGHLIDTPGIKTLTLHEESKDQIKYIFPGFRNFAGECYFPNCTHIHEKDCAVKKAVENNLFDSERYESYLRIMESFTGIEYE